MNQVNFQKTALLGTAFLMITGALILFAGHGKNLLSSSIGAAFLTLWAIWWFLAISFKSQPFFPKNQKNVFSQLIYGSIILLLCFGAPWEYLHFSAPIPRDSWLAWGGVAVTIFSIALLTSAMWSNGSILGFSNTSENEYYIFLDGPYHYIRYPGYLSIILFVTGCALCLSSLIGWAAFFITIGFTLYQIHQAEGQIKKFSPEILKKIKKQTPWALFPGIF